MASGTPGASALFASGQAREGYGHYWGQYASAATLPNAVGAGNALNASQFKLEAGDVAFVTGLGPYTCTNPGTAGGNDAVWVAGLLSTRTLTGSAPIQIDGSNAAQDLSANRTISFTPTADVSMASHKLTNVTDPTAAQDAATKAYVDSVAAGLSPKPSVFLATAAALPAYTYLNGVAGVGATLTATPASGVLTVDGTAVTVTVPAMRILVKNETAGNAPYNGIYFVTTIGTGIIPWVLTRALDQDQAAEFDGAFVFAESGAVNAGSGFVCTSSVAVVGTDAVSWTQFSGAGEITAGAGLTKTGNTLAADFGTGANKVLQATSAALISAFATLAASISFNSQKITSLAAGTATTDAANYGQAQQAPSRTDATTTPALTAADIGGFLKLSNAGAITLSTLNLSGSLIAARGLLVSVWLSGGGSLTIGDGAGCTHVGAPTAGSKATSLYSDDGVTWIVQ